MISSANPPAGDSLLLAHDLHQRGQLAQAGEIYQRILQSDPLHFDALHLSGVLAFQQGDPAAAVERIRRALAVRPTSAAYANLAAALAALHRNDEAITALQAAVALEPGNNAALEKLAQAFKEQGRYDEAARTFSQLLSRVPESFFLAASYAQVEQARGNIDAAIALYQRALRYQPDHPDVLATAGSLLLKQKKFAEAEPLLQRAARMQPDAPDLHGNLGILLVALRRPDEAAVAFRRSLQLKPDNFRICRHFVKMLLDRTWYEEAEQVARLGARRWPDDPLICVYLGLALLNQGKHAEMRDVIRAAPAMRGTHGAHSTLLYLMLCDSQCTPEQYLDEARRYGQAVSGAAEPFARWSTMPGEKLPSPLRVGFVSGDLRTHPVGFFLENLVAHLDPQQVELVAYSTHDRADALTTRIRPCFSAWHDISRLSDVDAASRIHRDGMHILIDLSGHTTHNKLPLFAWKPAPVQATWLGYFGSTGVSAIDFILVDPVSVPVGEHSRFVELPWYMPETRLCFTPPRDPGIPAPSPLPALRNGHITFGSFQNTVKLDASSLALWARVLRRIPRSRLRLQNVEMASPTIRNAFLQRLADLGIPADRIDMTGAAPRIEYLAAHADIDMILDTCHYPGGTTTCEALWMGVPTLTLRGNSLLSRQGASLLTAAGLENWIADDEQDFEERAFILSEDIPALARLRANLRTRTETSVLCDGARFARHFTAAMYGMWNAQAAGART